MQTETLYIFAIAGAVGAIVSDILKDNSLEMPKFNSGKFYLGFVGSVIIGAVAGYYIDGTLIMAFMGGFVGKSVIENLVPKNFDDLLKKKEEIINTGPTNKTPETIINESVEETIRRIAKLNKVDPDLAVRIAKCESALKPGAINVNTAGSKDRGIFQWNDHFHPEVSDECAFDVVCATQKFCEAANNDNLSWWNASKKCWDKPTT